MKKQSSRSAGEHACLFNPRLRYRTEGGAGGLAPPPPPICFEKKKKVSCLASPHPPALLAVAYAFVFNLPLKIQVCGADPESIVHLNRIYLEMTSFVTFILQVSFVHRKRTKT